MVLLATALVKVNGINGNQETLRALIDPGSQSSFLTENAAQLLSLPRFKTSAKISGIGGNDAGIVHYKVQLNIKPRFPSNFQLLINAMILQNLTKLLPDSTVPKRRIGNNQILADPTYNKPGPIDLILGADVYPEILLKGVRKHQEGLVEQETELGWILTGQTSQQSPRSIYSLVVKTDIDDTLRKFWELEEVPTTLTPNTGNECDVHYSNTHIRNSDGTYTVKIPFKANKQKLGESRRQAMARFLQLERRFLVNKNLADEYKKFIQEYITLGHMKPVEGEVLATEEVYYMPHQAVIKADSSTTKLRVVFDASSKTSNGVSLNDNMLTGPRLQADLATILLRWRKHKYVFTADVEKMYRQIRINKEDQNYQRILWRFSPKEPIREYKLTTVTYGTAAAPYLAIKTMQQLAKDEEHKYPSAARVVREDFYVDDMLSGANTLQQSKIIQTEILQLMTAGGFSLRKWTSNNAELLMSIPDDKLEKGVLEITSDETVKTLGIYWSPKTDKFQIKVKSLATNTNLTKRILLSEIAKIFDPLGWLTPVIITAKKMIQELWLSGVKWDDPLPDDLSKKWTKFQKSLSSLQQINIPRWMHIEPSNERVELNGYCDASEKAYAAVIYSKVIDSEGKSYTRLVIAKSKVAPIKSKATIPKLELCAAHLLAKLLAYTIKSLDIKSSSTNLWTDSQIVLAWIKGDPCRWEKFVSHKITEIQSLTNPNQWQYINTTQNPADCASRGLNPEQLKDHPLWWTGPTCIQQPEKIQPITTIFETKCETPEVKVMISTSDTTILERFSTLNRLTRVLAYCNRFISNCRRSKTTYASIVLTAEEINTSKNQAIQITQAKEFHEEINALRSRKYLLSKSKLAQFNPFVDDKGLLRIGGRLQQSFLSFDEKHPIILPQKSHLTTLIIRDAHIKTLHGGNQNTLAFIRRQFWIINGRSVIRQHIHRCIKCFRYKAKTEEQQMGSLPSSRVSPSRPFTHTGVDYAGPLQIRTSRTRGLSSFKGYIAVFICMATKAVHLEAVSDLTTDSFLAAFKRFTARRGLCADIYSDCGTNFVGAQRVLDQDLREAIKHSEQHVAKLFAGDKVKWHFNPPGAPHFGGLWESAVKSVKYHMKRIIGEVKLTFEELSTVLYQIEGCLNSRPLCQLTCDPQDCNVLTPGHFLIGSAPVSPPQPFDLEGKINLLKRWRLVEKISRDIWKSWSSEYLSQLQQRSKWRNSQPNIKSGELVLIKEENLPPGKWLLGRVTKTYPGRDDKVRVVELRCKGNSELTRPITKICKLPIEEIEMNDNQVLITQITSYHTSKTTLSLAKNLQIPSRLGCHKRTHNESSHRPPKKPRIYPVTGYNNLIQMGNKGIMPRNKKQKSRETQIQEAKECPAKKRITLETYRIRKRDQCSTFLTCLLLLLLVKLGKAGYNITHPSPGLYIEHVGDAKVQRGILRLELNYPINITRDTQYINETVRQMSEICEKGKKRSEEIHCEMLLHHLQEKQSILLRDMDTLNMPHPVRSRRGVFGNILQYLFGVNDEAYTDIDNLKQNQMSILQATQHQTTLMLSTTAQIKDLETVTQQKFNSFTQKLNKAIEEINKVEGWYTSIDVNRINIHILAAYDIAIGVLEELEARYNLLIKIILQKVDLLECLSAGEVMHVIQKASGKMPPNVEILPTPEHKVESSRNDTHITAYGFLKLATANKFELVKITPIPQRLNSSSYALPRISKAIFATDYNSQTYFELSEEEFDRCMLKGKHLFLCSPTVISRIDSNPNCILDEIYRRHEKTPCTFTNMIIPHIVFKHMYQINTWLFITNKATSAAVVCNGIHEDIEFKDIGIIQIDNGCIIKTKRNIITSEIVDTLPVRATYNQPLNFNLSQVKISEVNFSSTLVQETVLSPSDRFSNIMQQEERLQDGLLHHGWKTVGHHAATGFLTLGITLILLFLIYKYRRWSKAAPAPQPARRTTTFMSNLQPCPTTRKFDISQLDCEPAPSEASAEGAGECLYMEVHRPRKCNTTQNSTHES